MPDVKIVTFNVRGLRDMSKRRTIFRFLHHCYPTHIVVPTSRNTFVSARLCDVAD